MQACPYDALYIDPQTETAAKCNFCAHRVEVGLEPPCVTVCPTQAIVAGDMSDPGTRIAQLTGRHAVQVRKPEKGTLPRVFYLEADSASLVPAAAPPASDYMWADAPQAAALPAMSQNQEADTPRRSYGVREQHRNSWGGGPDFPLPLDQVAGCRCVDRTRAGFDRRGPAGSLHCVSDVHATRSRPHRSAVGRRPAPAATLPVDTDAPAVALLAGARRLHHHGLRRCRHVAAGGPPRRRPPPVVRPPDQCPARRGHRGLHRVPVRAVQGSRSLAVTALGAASAGAGDRRGRGAVPAGLAAVCLAAERPPDRSGGLGGTTPAKMRGARRLSSAATASSRAVCSCSVTSSR